MNIDEKTRFDKMEKSVESILSDVSEIKSAILGNPMSGDKGIRGRIDGIEIEQESQAALIKTLIEEKIKNAIYIKLINWLLIVIGGGVITGIIALIFNVLKK